MTTFGNDLEGILAAAENENEVGISEQPDTVCDDAESSLPTPYDALVIEAKRDLLYCGNDLELLLSAYEHDMSTLAKSQTFMKQLELCYIPVPALISTKLSEAVAKKSSGEEEAEADTTTTPAPTTLEEVVTIEIQDMNVYEINALATRITAKYGLLCDWEEEDGESEEGDDNNSNDDEVVSTSTVVDGRQKRRHRGGASVYVKSSMGPRRDTNTTTTKSMSLSTQRQEQRKKTVRDFIRHRWQQNWVDETRHVMIQRFGKEWEETVVESLIGDSAEHVARLRQVVERAKDKCNADYAAKYQCHLIAKKLEATFGPSWVDMGVVLREHEGGINGRIIGTRMYIEVIPASHLLDPTTQQPSLETTTTTTVEGESILWRAVDALTL